MIPVDQWQWFGHAGHLIVGQWCRFHLATKVGDYLVSTVGEYWPSRASREIHARIYDLGWYSDNVALKGDAFDAAYMERFGFEEIGCDRKYETMVFKAGTPCDAEDCHCGLPDIDGNELDFAPANDAKTARDNHMELCMKAARGEIGKDEI